LTGALFGAPVAGAGSCANAGSANTEAAHKVAASERNLKAIIGDEIIGDETVFEMRMRKIETGKIRKRSLSICSGFDEMAFDEMRRDDDYASGQVAKGVLPLAAKTRIFRQTKRRPRKRSPFCVWFLQAGFNRCQER